MQLEHKKINTINEQNYKSILKNYNFLAQDAVHLESVQALVIKYEEELLDGFYEFIFKFDYAKSFLHNQEILTRHKKGIASWYKALFCGKYDELYFFKLNQISEIHVQIGLPAHYVNAAFSYIRGFLKKIFLKEQYLDVISSLDKILDINLDILTISYRQEEQTKLIDEVLFLKGVVENKNIEAFAQGIYNTKTSKVEKYESLMRLVDVNTKEVRSVFAYLALSKKLKLYESMMRIMVDKTFENFKNKDVDFSLNLSYEDISNESFVEFIYEKINSYDFSSNIIFEILETDFIEDFSIVEEFAKNVRKRGCKIAIDDFGSGFSSMENIMKLKPEFIKIDASLIKNIHINSDSLTIVKSIITMAKQLNSKTVAEYVHNKEVFDVLNSLEVDYMQGFYLSKPMKVDFL